jgi:hypothetical protein
MVPEEKPVPAISHVLPEAVMLPTASGRTSIFTTVKPLGVVTKI